MKYGYARVSTKKQELARQLDSLESHGVEKIFTDKYTGTKVDRKGYLELKDAVRKGDEVYIHALDRLGRNKLLIKQEIEWFKSNGVILRILNMPTTLIQIDGQEWVIEMINNIILEVLSTLAQQEHDDIVRRVTEGLEATKKRGTKLGRKEIDTQLVDKAHSLVADGISVTEACRTVGIGRTTYYKFIDKVSSL